MSTYKKKVPFSVAIPSGKTCVFLSNQDMTGLGPTITGVNPYTIPAEGSEKVVNHFINANYPRLPRVTIQLAGGKRKSTFCNATTASGKGDISKPKRAYGRVHLAADNKRVVSVFVLTLGIKYAWNMPKWQYDLITADLTGLGIEPCTKAGAPEYVWGASAPYPARITKFDAGGTEAGNRYTTFCSQAKESGLPEGWAIVSESIDVGEFLRK